MVVPVCPTFGIARGQIVYKDVYMACLVELNNVVEDLLNYFFVKFAGLDGFSRVR